MSHTLLVTGAAGYIGSHFVEALYESGLDFLSGAQLVLVDNLSLGNDFAIRALAELARERGFPVPRFYQTDLLDVSGLDAIFRETSPDAVFHFAAKISVAESVEKPDFYFENNVVGSKNLLDAMKKIGCMRIVFSSTAAVYGKVEDPLRSHHPIPEETPLVPVNPYGKTKLMMEKAIEAAYSEWGLQSVIFRYFNAAGASTSGRLGECHEPETHLVPLLIRAALSDKALAVFGTHYDTRDGSCIRDYVHVADLASAHLLGFRKMLDHAPSDPLIFNLGTEKGSTVLEVIEAVKVLTGKAVRLDIRPNRAGDSAVLIADSSRARKELEWKPTHSSLYEILKTVLDWEKKHHAR